MKISGQDVQKLRQKTAIGVMECKKALEKAKGNLEKATEILRKKGALKALKKSQRTASQGIIASYVHAGGKIGVLLELACETDFVAKNRQFSALAHDIAMQIASMNSKKIDELMKQEFIKNPDITIKELIDENVAKIGENIKVKRFIRYQLGE